MSESTCNQELCPENFQEQVLAIKRTIIDAWISDFSQIPPSPKSFSPATALPQHGRRRRSLKSRRMMEDNTEPLRRSKRILLPPKPRGAFNRQDIANTNKETTTGYKYEGAAETEYPNHELSRHRQSLHRIINKHWAHSQREPH
jgi:hypothetical protein